jgi:hypothetical protein
MDTPIRRYGNRRLLLYPHLAAERNDIQHRHSCKGSQMSRQVQDSERERIARNQSVADSVDRHYRYTCKGSQMSRQVQDSERERIARNQSVADSVDRHYRRLRNLWQHIPASRTPSLGLGSFSRAYLSLVEAP